MKTENEAIYHVSADTRVTNVRVLARQIRMGSALTPELQEAISDLNAEACKAFNRSTPPPKRSRA